MKIFRGGGGNSPGGSLIGGNFPGGSFPDTSEDALQIVKSIISENYLISRMKIRFNINPFPPCAETVRVLNGIKVQVFFE